MLRRLLSLVALCITLLSKVVYSQDACERIIVDNLGRSDMLGNTGLVASVMAPTGEAGNIVDVRILNMTIVCEAQHMMQDRYRYTSVVVSFNCFTADNRVPECADSSVVNTEQFDFGCVSGAWSRNILSDSTAARTTNPTATLSTGLDTDCIVCINPNNAEAMFLPNPVDSVTHCVDCANCPIGLQRCYYPEGTIATEVCCNYFHEGTCVTECPDPLIPGTSFPECGCTVLSNANGGFAYTSEHTITSIATLTCNPGFVVSGTNPVTCQVTGWTGMPTCEPIECEPLPAIANGVITYAPDSVSNYSLGTTATYSCNTGFSLDVSVGSETRTCTDDGDNDVEGVFDRQAPTCVPIECEPLSQIDNGVITYSPDTEANYALGTVATYACNSGYVLDFPGNSSETRTCIDDSDMDALGTFDQQAPVCIPIECLPLAAIANGVITYAPDNTSNYTLGTEATYACNAGFILDLSVGSETRTCIDDGDMDAEGVFTLQAPQCIPIECEPLPVIANGVITYAPDSVSNYSLGTTATYSCTTGFSLDLSAGSETRICVDDGDNDVEGVFNGQAPTCVPIECEPLSAIANGVITYAPDSVPNYSLGTTATYSCSTGFSLDISAGSETRTCVDDGDNDAEGIFDRQAPTCVLICPDIAQLDNGAITYSDPTIPRDTGSTATYSCSSGYELEGNSMRTCTTSGWSGSDPNCTALPCPRETPSGGTVTYSMSGDPLPAGTMAIYSCDTGYDLIGDETRTCTEENGWTGSLPICKIVDCGNPPPITNGMVIFTNTTFGSTATYSCDIYYTLTGDITRVCEADGLYSGSEPTCNLTCPDIAQPDDGAITYSDPTIPRDTGSTVTYNCSTGYVLRGNSMRTCTASGWNGSDPYCTVLCPRETLSNGTVTYSMPGDPPLVGTVATYSCNTGYDLTGDEMSTCEETTGWSKAPPICRIVDCGEPIPVEYGTVIFTSTTFGSTVTYSCETGYALNGDMIRVCGADEMYSGPEPTCDLICPDLHQPVNGDVMHSDLTIPRDTGSTATYSCSTGYELVGNLMRTCTASGWNGSDPDCTVVCSEMIPNCETCLLNERTMTFICTACSSSEYRLRNGECTPIACNELNDDNGNFDYTNDQFIGSVATLTCNGGFSVSGTNPVTCQASEEWTGVPTCEPQPIVSCDTGCIIGLSVLGALILLLIITLLVVAICLTVSTSRKSKTETSHKPVGDGELDKSAEFDIKEMNVLY